MTWESSWAFLLLVPIVLCFIWFLLSRKSRLATLQISSLRLFKGLNPSPRAHLRYLPLGLQFIGFVLMVVAFARPQTSSTKIKRNVEGIDIMVALDVSDSMLIEDMRPENRLEASKKVIREFIEQRVSDRIGLVVFSGESYTRVPLTLDYPLLLQSLSEVKTSRNIKMGTAIGVALANSVARLKDSTAKSRVVIFLTDGENNSGTIDPQTALEIAKGYKIKIYSIGMGRDGQAQLPVYVETASGRRIKQYRPMHSKVNDELLTQMAKETGGKYFRAQTGRDLKTVFESINNLEKTEIETNQLTRYKEEFSPYLKWAIFFSFLASLLSFTWLRTA